MRKIALICFLILLVSTQLCVAQKVTFNWGTQQANLNYKQCYQSFKKLNLGEAKTKKLTDCVFSKLKSKFPKGVDLPNSEFIEVNRQLYISCLEEQKVQSELPFLWNEHYLKGFRSEMLKSMPSEFSDDLKNKLIDCFLKKLKKKYPTGGFKISEIKSDYEKIIADCQSEEI